MEEQKQSTASYVKDIKRRTYRRFSSEEKIKFVLMGLRGEAKVSELCRQVGISESLYYKWNKDFMEAGKRRMEGDNLREASSSEVKQLRQQLDEYKQMVAELSHDNRMLKKSLNGSM